MAELYQNITEVGTADALTGSEDIYVRNGDGFRRVPLSVLDARYIPIVTVTSLPTDAAEHPNVLYLVLDDGDAAEDTPEDGGSP